MSMPVRIDSTPNPNAMKFTVGTPVGGPTTFSSANPSDDPLGTALLGIAGVAGVFMTADFFTVTKDPSAVWDGITDAVVIILEDRFG